MKNKIIWRRPLVLFEVLTKTKNNNQIQNEEKRVGSNKSNAMSCSTQKTMQKNQFRISYMEERAAWP